ncbi:hypothetical protein A1F94_012155 [Pyrenophora tritici-repentis]|uniref:Granulin domain containing protein n=1 Tax=Pyrenophora tritici-repentis TaxID=45151 RepID=A0A834VV77_9PLEO|nr:hypothetical protein A1F99_000600 [Pyrenophora tritici-repentis]KAF7575829.1 Granulin domain containing protein [Pyrenophora tritici-repentis]KAG9377752.1 hypothetical protein A1F94_012155 [Pyrenophora tritici-repentis]
MQIQAIVLALVATTYATSCYKHQEKFLPSHAEVHAGGTTTEDWSYCPDENGCCSDGKTFYRCKNLVVPALFLLPGLLARAVSSGQKVRIVGDM